MSFPANEEAYLALIRRLLNFEVGGEVFCVEFMSLWKADRDEQYAERTFWGEKYDSQLINTYIQGTLSAEEFSQKYAELWGYTEYQSLLRMLDQIFTACDCFDPKPDRLLYEIDECQLRQEVAENIASYQGSKVNHS